MDPVSGLKSDVFRSLATVIVPGVVAAFPYALLVFDRFPSAALVLNSPFGIGIAVLFVGTAVGMLMEDLGSEVETQLWRWFVRSEAREQEWDDYLQLSITNDVVGQRYLDSVHVRLKYELAMIPALLTCAVGCDVYNWSCGVVPWHEVLLLNALILLACTYLAYEAYTSLVVLADTRKLLLTACGTAPSGGSSCPAVGGP